jgi:U3 small nucleolar ribonucleoprotein protein IMP3
MDYRKYNTLCGSLRQLAHKLSQLDPDADPLRKKLESELLEKLWRMGILKQSREQGAGLSKIEREVTVSAFCRRRLAVFMVRSGMVETIKAVSWGFGSVDVCNVTCDADFTSSLPGYYIH